MSHRIGRVAHVIRDVVSDCIANRLSDPRIQRFTSVTRVELSPDLRIASVHVSVMGTAAEARTTMQGLESARGLVQTRLAKQLDMRQCPLIRFILDEGLKKAADLIRQIDETMAQDAAARRMSGGGDEEPDDLDFPDEIDPLDESDRDDRGAEAPGDDPR
ncbi:MAG: hypothetical protein HBSAPP02_12920 [Phycisphaerae bacterium]|nr:MAG: 30S ribosome-binding factor RbfA [Planctomycetota bacterium]GJQ26260.1 MAG: hypothetical protein HBSAPP02_12920 [Phycisphaerae bacterium]